MESEEIVGISTLHSSLSALCIDSPGGRSPPLRPWARALCRWGAGRRLSIRRPRLPLYTRQSHDRIFRIPPVDLREADVRPAAGQSRSGHLKVPRVPAGGLERAVDPPALRTLPPPAEGAAAVVQDDFPVRMPVIRPLPAAGGRGGLRFFPMCGGRFLRSGCLALPLIQMGFFGVHSRHPFILKSKKWPLPMDAAISKEGTVKSDILKSRNGIGKPPNRPSGRRRICTGHFDHRRVEPSFGRRNPKQKDIRKNVLLLWKGRLKSTFLNGEKCRPQGGLPAASPAQRVAVGKEEQGSGRMTSFCLWHKKTSEQSGLCSDVVRGAGLEPARP